MMSAEEEVLEITHQMLDAMYTSNPEVHRKHSAEDMSSYEWYIAPQRIDGLAFHLALIEGGGNGEPSRLDMLTPRVQIYGDTAIVNYTLLKTTLTETAPPQFSTMNETRVFVKLDGIWKMVHLHKSPT
ncbi:MAG: nuclear transport factor 2 family protein [Janthinobacterium lividum]